MIVRIVITLALLLLASCGGKVRDGAPDRDIDVSRVPDAVPRQEPITRAGNKSPYKVLGKTYHVLPSFKNYRARGLASWYGTKFHGRLTSNGEPYDMYAMTAAHKTLPIPCYVQVTNLHNGRKAIVRVNDRGPFHDDRIIDLSYAAARKLGVYSAGTAEVEVVAIDPASYRHGYMAESTVSNKADSDNPGSGVYLQVGAFSSRQAADKQRQQSLRGIDFPTLISQEYSGGKSLYKVLVGPFSDENNLLAAREVLERRARLSSFVVYK